MLFHWNDWFQFYLAGFSSQSTALEVYWLILLSLCFFLSFPLSDLSCFLCVPLSLGRLLYSTELVLPPNSIEVCQEVQVNPSRLQQVFLEYLSSHEPIVTERAAHFAVDRASRTWQVGFLFPMESLPPLWDSSSPMCQSDSLMWFLTSSTSARARENYKVVELHCVLSWAELKLVTREQSFWMDFFQVKVPLVIFLQSEGSNLLKIEVVCNSSEGTLWDFGIHQC